MDCGVVGCCGCAECEGAGDDARVDLVGAGKWVGRWGGGVHGRSGVTEGGFEWEGVGCEPVQEGRLAEDADIGVLRCVDVCVWEISGVRRRYQSCKMLRHGSSLLARHFAKSSFCSRQVRL